MAAQDVKVIYQSEAGHIETDKPRVFLQWKNMESCIDFYCECGAHHHVDEFFVYALKCEPCGALYEMPSIVVLKRVSATESLTHICTAEALDEN